MFEDYHTWLNIPYIKLHFTAAAAEDCRLPRYKASGLRGGTGKMMMQQHCILPHDQQKDEDCVHCDCSDECLVQRFLYTPSTIAPDLSNDKMSLGYIFSCENYQEKFHAGETFEFQVTLFGKSRVYLSLLFQALYNLGNAGLGNSEGRFYITEIRNSRKEPILRVDEYGMQIMKQACQPETLADYVDYRLRQMRKCGKKEISEIRFPMDTTIVYQKKVQEKFSMEAIVKNLARRIYLYNCFAGNEMELDWFTEDLLRELPEIENQEVFEGQVRRYSTRQRSSMNLKGIHGTVYLKEAPSQLLLPYLIAGEITHIGKNTSFGFGRYRLM